MEWLDKAMAVVGFDENLRERLRREHGIVMTAEELSDRLGVKDWVVEKGGKGKREDKVIRGERGAREGFKTRMMWDETEDAPYHSMQVEVAGLSRYEAGDYSDLEGWKRPTYNNPRAQYEFEQRMANGVVTPIPGSTNMAGIIANFRQVSDNPGLYTLQSIETYRMEPRKEGQPMGYTRDSTYFDADDMQAQGDALDNLRTAMEASRANQMLPAAGLPHLGVNPELEQELETETPKADRRRELQPPTPGGGISPGF